MNDPASIAPRLRPQPWREATRGTGRRWERAMAASVALLANAAVLGLLLRALQAAPPDPLATQDDAIEVVWIEPPPSTTHEPAAVPDTAELRPEAVLEAPVPPQAAPDMPAPVDAERPMDANDAAQAAPAWAGGQIPADESPLPIATPPMEDENGRPIVAGPDAVERGAPARNGAFGDRPEDPFKRQADGPFRMQDNSLGGRMQRMTRRADCAELKGRLRGGGPDVDAIVRTMVALRCT